MFLLSTANLDSDETSLSENAIYWTVGRNDGTGPKHRQSSEAMAELRIQDIEKVDPIGVHNGDYYLDGPCSPEEADYDYVQMSNVAVMVTSAGLRRFASKWPCSGLRFDRDIAVQFQYGANGLEDIQWFDCSDDSLGIDITEPLGIDGLALAALSRDAQGWLTKQVGF